MPAVLVHGVPDTHRLWDRVRAELKRTDIIALSLPGFDAPIPDGFRSTKEEYLAWLIEQIEAIGEPVDLVGHDWGCLLTARIASVRPDLVRTWTGINGPLDPEYKWHYLAEIWQEPGEGEKWMAALDAAEFARNLIDARMPPEDAHESVSHIDDQMKAGILALYRSAINVGAEWKPGLASVQAPALVIWGIDDPYLPNRFADLLGEATRARAVVKLRATHWPLLNVPSDVARELEAHWATGR